MRWQVRAPTAPGQGVTPAAAAAHGNLLEDPENLLPRSAATPWRRRLLHGGTKPGKICLATAAAQTGVNKLSPGELRINPALLHKSQPCSHVPEEPSTPTPHKPLARAKVYPYIPDHDESSVPPARQSPR